MALYGVLAVAESGGGLYKTPSVLDDYVDDGRLVTIRLDLTGPSPEIVGVEQDVMREDDVSKLGYSHKSSGQGSKYSLTQTGSSTGNDAEGVADTRYGPLGKLAGWADQKSIQALTGDNGHPDGWIIDGIAEAFEKDSSSLERVRETLFEILPEGESVPTVLSVLIRADTSKIEGMEDVGAKWMWPDEIGVLNTAMERYAVANATDKNITSGPPSEGQAVGVVTDEEGYVVGTPESPLDVFSVKHPDAQPGLRKDQSWRSYPVAADTAMLFSKGAELIDQCVYRRGGMETYALPYFAGEMTGQKAEALYLAIDSVKKDVEIEDSLAPPMAQITFDLEESDDYRELAERELRFYTITMPISDDKNIVAEEPAASTYWPSTLAEALRETIQGPTLRPEAGGFAKFDNWPLLTLTGNRSLQRKKTFSLVTNYQFTDSVFAYRDEEGDDFRRLVDNRLIAGTPIQAATLFEEYMGRYNDASEDGEAPPHQVVVQQLVHLETLSRAGLLTGIDQPIEPQDSAMTSELDTTDIAAIREGRLESFLDRPLFEETNRRAAALAGVLVGQVSWHQDSVRNIGRPLDSGTKGDQLTKNSLENALTAALEKSKVYAQDSDKSYDRDLLFPETVDRLLEETEEMPSDWTIEKRELQFCYVLGHAHGRRSMPVAFDLHESEDDKRSEPTADEPVTN
jgi:CRISPR-associated protein Cas8b/Csh1 subtype I-B